MSSPRSLKLEEEEIFDNSEEIANEEKQKSLQRLNKVSGVASILDMADISGIFAMHINDDWREILNKTARYPMFIIAAMFAFISAGLSIRKASLDGKSGSIEQAIIKSLSALFIGAAVGFALFGPTELAELAAPIFAGVLGFQGLLGGIKAMVAGIKASKTSDPDKNREYHEQARGNGIGMVVGLAITAAVIGVMILKHNEVAYLGVGAGVLGMGYTARQLAKSSSKKTDGYTQVPSDDVELELEESPRQKNKKKVTSNLQMTQGMKQAKKQAANNPYQPIPDFSQIDTKENPKSPADNVIPLPSVASLNLGGAIKSADEMNKLKKTGTDSASNIGNVEKNRSRRMSYNSSDSDSSD